MTMPFIQILLALRAEVTAAVAGTTIDDLPITVRHHRHREASEDEWPCVSLRYMSNDVSQRFGRQESNGGLPELVMELSVDLIIDAALDPEETDPTALAGDPTGFDRHAQILSLILDRLLPDLENGAEPNTLGGTTWEITYDGTAPNEGDGTPDQARMEERLTLLYRVRADHPTLLLES